MPLDFRASEVDEGFSIKRFLRTFGLGIGVFLFFLALGYYVLGPRIRVSDEGRIRFVLSDTVSRTETGQQTEAVETTAKKAPLPKVEVYEKLPPDVVAGTGVIIGSREVAPFNYDEYQRRRGKRKQKPKEPESSEILLEPEEDYFVPEPSKPDPAEPSSTPEVPDQPPTPSAPPTSEPSPSVEPEPVTPKTPDTASGSLYRVQIGVYESRENANNVAQAVRAGGFEATIVPFQREGRTLYRVQSLVTRDRAKAEQLKQQLESLGFPAVIATLN